MQIALLGPWVLMALGATAVVAAVVQSFRAAGDRWRMTLLLVAGILLMGLGIYGPMFLKDYGEFLKIVGPLKSMETDPGAASYRQVFDRIGDGDMPQPYRQLAIAYALNRPIEQMDGQLQEAIDAATDAEGRQTLVAAQSELARKKSAAAEIVTALKKTNRLTADAIRPFDHSTRMLIANELLASPETRENRAIDATALRELGAP